MDELAQAAKDLDALAVELEQISGEILSHAGTDPEAVAVAEETLARVQQRFDEQMKPLLAQLSGR